MTDLPPPPPPPLPLAREKHLSAQPTFFRGLRGIWSLTWKSQLTWQRLPLIVLTLLALPVLVYITTLSAQAWSQRHTWAGDATAQVRDFSRRLGRSGRRLQPDQEAKLAQIFSEEYARAENDSREALSPEAGAERQREQINAC